MDTYKVVKICANCGNNKMQVLEIPKGVSWFGSNHQCDKCGCNIFDGTDWEPKEESETDSEKLYIQYKSLFDQSRKVSDGWKEMYKDAVLCKRAEDRKKKEVFEAFAKEAEAKKEKVCRTCNNYRPFSYSGLPACDIGPILDFVREDHSCKGWTPLEARKEQKCSNCNRFVEATVCDGSVVISYADPDGRCKGWTPKV